MISRQRKWQLKKEASGHCQICGNINDGPWKSLCPECGLKLRKSNRKRAHCKVWKLGGRGRRPLEVNWK